MKTYVDSNGPNDWSPSRYHHVLELRQNALDEAKRQNADFLFVSLFELRSTLVVSNYFIFIGGLLQEQFFVVACCTISSIDINKYSKIIVL